MASENSIQRYRNWYARLLRLYPKPYRDRFGEGMAQTFNDLCRERPETGAGLLALAFWVFAETSAGIIRERKATMFKQNKRLTGIVIAIVILLLVPLVAMQFTDEVDWSLGDFVGAGVLLFGTALTYEWIARRAGNTAYRVAVGVALGASLILVWLNLAVGLIGSEDNPANLLYLWVLFVGLIGTGIARFQPKGMSRALFATALAQALVPVIALIIWTPSFAAPPGLVGVFTLNTLFVTLFAFAALLFRHAGSANPT